MAARRGWIWTASCAVVMFLLLVACAYAAVTFEGSSRLGATQADAAEPVAPAGLEQSVVVAGTETVAISRDTPVVEAPPVEPWVTFTSADGAISFRHPASWGVRVWDDSHGPFLTLTTPDGYDALDIRLTPSQEVPWTTTCETASLPFAVVASEPIDPFVDALDGATDETLELATVSVDGGSNVILSILQSSQVAASCLNTNLLIDGGAAFATSPWGTDTTGLIYERFAQPADLLVSEEYAVMLDVMRSLELRHFGSCC